jgi:hypothetical protein
VFLGFIGFNLENRCDISFGFYTFSQVPVFLTTFSAFVLGMFLALPLVISFRARHPQAKKEGGSKDPTAPVPDATAWGKGKKRGEADHISRGTEPHGID